MAFRRFVHLFVLLLLNAWPTLPSPVKQAFKTLRTAVAIADGSPIRFHHLSTADGLSQTRVSQIVQDDRGFMWFGTQYGLNRFDGYRFKIFVHDSSRPDSLSGVYISTLFKDHNGTLWVGGDAFLDRYDPLTEGFRHFRIGEDLNSPPTVYQISETGDGTLWLSTGKGLYSLDPSTGRIRHFGHSARDNSSLGYDDIKSTGEDRQGTFWVAHTFGFDRFDRSTGKVSLHIPLAESGTGLIFHEDRRGTFWIIFKQDGRIAVLDRDQRVLNMIGNETAVYAMLEDRDGNMWFGTGSDGLVRFDAARKTFIRYRNDATDDTSLADNRVNALFQDREGNIWAGLHASGVNFFSPERPLFENPAPAATVSKIGLVTTLREDSQGILWLGSQGKLNRIDRRKRTNSTFPETTGADVLSVVEEEPDVLWIAASSRGLFRWNRRTGAIKNYQRNDADQNTWSVVAIERLLLSSQHTLWAATWAGLARLDPATDKFKTYWPDNGVKNLNFHAIAEDRGGTLWLGSSLGLYRFDPRQERFTLFNNNPRDPHSLSDNRVNSVYIDSSGVIWVGTQNGLDRFDPDKHSFAVYSQKDGLGGNVVSCILEDDRHVLWMGTNNGVSSFNPRSTVFGNYGVADGLPGKDMTGWGTCAKNADGEIFFGGFSGATVFRSDRASNHASPPAVVLTSFRLFGAELNPATGSPLPRAIESAPDVRLFYWQNFFALEFSALSYFSPATNRYRYKLEGLDPHWVEVGADRRLANYTSVPPGTYVFRVQGATSRGPWSEPGVVLAIHVLPPWWKTIWFQTALLIVGIAAAMGLHSLRTRAITRRVEERFAERHAERLRIARELHDTLIQGCQGLIVNVQAAANKVPAELPARSMLNHALDLADEMIVEGRDRVRDLRSAESSGDSIIVTLRNMISILQKESRAALTFKVSGEPYPLRFDIHEDLLAVCREILNNSVRHAEAKRIDCDLRFSKREICFVCCDDGKGISGDILRAGSRPGHWGLVGMRERAKRMGGRLNLKSGDSAGTCAEIRVPYRFTGRLHRS